MIHAGRDIPVDRTDLVPGLVFTDLLEIHALTFKDAMILTGEGLGNEPVGADLDLANLFEDLAGDHAKEKNLTTKTERREEHQGVRL